jgi:hypothetical protein
MTEKARVAKRRDISRNLIRVWVRGSLRLGVR